MFEKLDLTFTRKIFKQKASTNTYLMYLFWLLQKYSAEFYLFNELDFLFGSVTTKTRTLVDCTWCSGAPTEPYQRKHTMIKYFKMEIILHVLFLCRNSASQDYLKSLAK